MNWGKNKDGATPETNGTSADEVASKPVETPTETTAVQADTVQTPTETTDLVKMKKAGVVRRVPKWKVNEYKEQGFTEK
jgi:hypothetical protein